jgi:hypothetical protein
MNWQNCKSYSSGCKSLFMMPLFWIRNPYKLNSFVLFTCGLEACVAKAGMLDYDGLTFSILLLLNQNEACNYCWNRHLKLHFPHRHYTVASVTKVGSLASDAATFWHNKRIDWQKQRTPNDRITMWKLLQIATVHLHPYSWVPTYVKSRRSIIWSRHEYDYWST